MTPEPGSDHNRFARDIQEKLDDFSMTYDEWCHAEFEYRELDPTQTSKFNLHQERMNKFEDVLPLFPKDLVTPIDGGYLRKVVRRTRQNKHKRKKTAQANRSGSSPTPGRADDMPSSSTKAKKQKHDDDDDDDDDDNQDKDDDNGEDDDEDKDGKDNASSSSDHDKDNNSNNEKGKGKKDGGRSTTPKKTPKVSKDSSKDDDLKIKMLILSVPTKGTEFPEMNLEGES